MTQPFLGQLLYSPYNFAPFRWALAQGQLMAIQQNTALFSLLGTFYGGNGTSTFALPDMRGRMPVHYGQGLGLSPYALGEVDGTENVTLLTSELPAHTHSLVASGLKATTSAPANASPFSMLGRAVATTQLPLVYVPSTSSPPMQNMAIQSIAPTSGGGLPFSIIQPVLTVNCSISLAGIYPARN